MKKKRIVIAASAVLTVALSLGSYGVALADENPSSDLTDDTSVSETVEYPSELSDLDISVKAGVSDSDIQSYIKTQIKKQNSDYDIAAFSFSRFKSENIVVVTFDNKQKAECYVNVDVIKPTGVDFASSLSSLSASSASNKSSSALLAYVNSKLDLVYVGDEDYENAYGTVSAGKASKFTWDDCDTTYNIYGGITYTFTQEYHTSSAANDVELLTRKVKVSAVENSISSVTIDYDDNTVSTTSDMKWSLDKSKWYSCKANMAIQESWYANTVYFKIPETDYSAASNIVSLKVPKKSSKPTTKLSLSSTSHSITILNCWDYNDVEYSIDEGDTWQTTRNEILTFDNLTANTSYKVMVRTCADTGTCLASEALTSSIKTKAVATTGFNVNNYVKNNIGYIEGSVGVSSDISGKSLYASLIESQFTKFNNVITTYTNKYDTVYSTLTIEQFMENNEVKELNQTELTLYMAALKKGIEDANLEIEYRSDYGRISISHTALERYLESNTKGRLTITAQKITSISSLTGWNWLRTAYNGGAPVYKFTVESSASSTTKPTLTYFIPYQLDNTESINSLKVYQVDSSGTKNLMSATYDSSLGGFTFSTAKTGYFTVINDGSTSSVFPFTDVSNSHWARSSIKYCYEKGLVNGTTTTTYSPSQETSKAMIIAMLARLDGYAPTKTTSKYSLTDIDSSDWYAEYAQWAYDNKIVTGKVFYGNDTLTRQEIARILYNYLKYKGYSLTFNSKNVVEYDDVKSIDDTYLTVVNFLKYKNIMVGDTNNNFNPKQNVTRAEMAAIMCRIIDYNLVNEVTQ